MFDFACWYAMLPAPPVCIFPAPPGRHRPSTASCAAVHGAVPGVEGSRLFVADHVTRDYGICFKSLHEVESFLPTDSPLAGCHGYEVWSPVFCKILDGRSTDGGTP